MNHVDIDKIFEEDALPIQEFLFDSKNLLVADQLFYKIGVDMKINSFSENYLQAFRKKTAFYPKEYLGKPEKPRLEITLLTFNPKQYHNIKAILKKPLSENVFEADVTQVSLVKNAVDGDGNIMKERPFYCGLGHTTQRDIVLKVSTTDKKHMKNFSELLGLEVMREATRKALYSQKLFSYYGQEGRSIEESSWAEDVFWYEFLAHGCHGGDRVFFSKKEVNAWLFANEIKFYDLHPSWAEILPHQYHLSGPHPLTSLKTVKESVDPAVEKRASLRLLALCQKELEKKGNTSFEKKQVLVDSIQDLAIKNGFELTNDIQKRLSTLSDEEKDQLDKTAVSREDVKAISTLLRSLKQQGGTSFKKNDDDSLKTIGIDG
jgi:hypothetical protein